MPLEEPAASRVVAARAAVTTSKSLFDRHSDMSRRLGASVTQHQELNAKVSDLKGKLASLEGIADTYDREFQDRTETGQVVGVGFFSRRGIATLQDWALFSFFATYVLMIVGLLSYALMYSTKKLIAVSAILGGGALFGVLSAALFFQFA